MGYDAFADAVGARAGPLGRPSAATSASWGPSGLRPRCPGRVERNGPRRWSGLDSPSATGTAPLTSSTTSRPACWPVLDALGLTELVTSIDGLSAVGAAAILAEAGDPARYDCARTWVKHAGLCQRRTSPAPSPATTRVSGRGRPALRTAAGGGPAGRTAAQRCSTPPATTTSPGGPTTPCATVEARTAIAGALLRQLFVVVTRRVALDPAIAGGDKFEGVVERRRFT